MSSITISEIKSGLGSDKTILIDSRGEPNGKYETIENALSSEPDAHKFILVNANSDYSPSSALSLSTNQKIMGLGDPTITTADIELAGENSVLTDITIKESSVTVSADNCTIKDGTVYNSKSSNIDDTTTVINSSNCTISNVEFENNRIELRGDGNRVNNCDIIGNITDEYDAASDKDIYYDEIQVIGKELSKVGEVITHTFSQVGEYDVSLEIENGDTATGTIRVGGTTNSTVSSSGDADFTISPLDPNPGEEVTFDGSNSTNAVSYNWTYESVGDYNFVSGNYVEGKISSPTSDYNQTNN